jgi:hypothetical protein
MGLVFIYKLDNVYLLAITSIFLVTGSLVLLKIQHAYRFFPLLTAVLLWALFGELGEHVNMYKVVSISGLILLFTFICVAVISIRKRILSQYEEIVVFLFGFIWFSHAFMMAIFKYFGKIHFLSYCTSIIFMIMLFREIFCIIKTKDYHKLTLHSVVITCCSWAMLEYVWAWNWLSKPW